MDTQIEEVRKLTDALIADSSLFVVDLDIKPGHNIKVYLDGDNGVSIDAMSKINKTLYKQLEAAVLFPDGDFSLEVSSPGVGAPLKVYRQYPKNKGRNVRVTLSGEKEIRGILKEVSETEIKVVQNLSAKQVKAGVDKEIILPFEEIKETVVEIKF